MYPQGLTDAEESLYTSPTMQFGSDSLTSWWWRSHFDGER